MRRIWTRKASLVQAGMITFHVSFVALLGGVVFNGLFHFNGVMRLTEGETLPNGSPSSYDSIEMGRFFDVARLRGETTLEEVHTGYKVDGADKRAAYEITVGEGAGKRTDIIYTTQNLEHEGIRYLRAKEGYSVGVGLYDATGEEIYAAMVPLQSLSSGAGKLYTTGSAQAQGAFNFPAPPEKPLVSLLVTYLPDGGLGREGKVTFQVGPVLPDVGEGAFRTGEVRVGESFRAGDYRLEAREIRYWVGMSVRYDPGLTVILTSLWAALAGVTLTFVGRIMQDMKRKGRGEGATGSPAADQEGGT